MSDTLPREPRPGPPRGFRPHMPLAVQRDAALIALGFDPANVDFHHSPPLALRPFDEAAGDVIPSANDPKHIVPIPRGKHRERTSGRNTKARAEGDQTEIAKTKRLTKNQIAFRRAMLMKTGDGSTLEQKIAEKGKRPWPKQKLRGRGFEKRRSR